jgi:hypothetical protein
MPQRRRFGRGSSPSPRLNPLDLAGKEEDLANDLARERLPEPGEMLLLHLVATPEIGGVRLPMKAVRSGEVMSFIVLLVRCSSPAIKERRASLPTGENSANGSPPL